jgi:Arc/MetJ family transcription regulator
MRRMAGTRICGVEQPSHSEVTYMPKVVLDIDDHLLANAAAQLGTASPKDTIEAALLAVTRLHDEDAADIADADAAMQEPGEPITLDQAESELDQLDAPASYLPESRQGASDQLLSQIKNGMLADLADPEIMRQAQR